MTVRGWVKVEPRSSTSPTIAIVSRETELASMATACAAETGAGAALPATCRRWLRS